MHPLRSHIQEVVELTDLEFETILSHFSEISINKGDKLVTVDSDVKDDWFLLEGYLQAYETDNNQKKRIIQLATKIGGYLIIGHTLTGSQLL